MYELFGLNAKTKVISNPYDAEFCQGKIVSIDNGYCLVRDPERIFTRLGWVVGNKGRKGFDYVKTVLMCEMANNYGVPLIYPYLRQLYLKCPGIVNLNLLDTYKQELYRGHSFWKYDNPNIYISRNSIFSILAVYPDLPYYLSYPTRS